MAARVENCLEYSSLDSAFLFCPLTDCLFYAQFQICTTQYSRRDLILQKFTPIQYEQMKRNLFPLLNQEVKLYETNGQWMEQEI